MMTAVFTPGETPEAFGFLSVETEVGTFCSNETSLGIFDTWLGNDKYDVNVIDISDEVTVTVSETGQKVNVANKNPCFRAYLYELTGKTMLDDPIDSCDLQIIIQS